MCIETVAQLVGVCCQIIPAWELIISFEKENYVPVMSGPTRLLVKNIPFNMSNAGLIHHIHTYGAILDPILQGHKHKKPHSEMFHL